MNCQSPPGKKVLLQVFSYLCRVRDKDETSKGWDRQRLPDSFYTLVEKYVLKPWSGKFSHTKSPSTRRKAWTKFVTEHMENMRKKLFYYLARSDKNQDEMVKTRYEARLKWFHKHYVRI